MSLSTKETPAEVLRHLQSIRASQNAILAARTGACGWINPDIMKVAQTSIRVISEDRVFADDVAGFVWAAVVDLHTETLRMLFGTGPGPSPEGIIKGMSSLNQLIDRVYQ